MPLPSPRTRACPPRSRRISQAGPPAPALPGPWEPCERCGTWRSAYILLMPAFPQAPRLAVNEASLEGSAGTEGGAESASGGGRVSSLDLLAPPSPGTQPLFLLQLRFTVGHHTGLGLVFRDQTLFLTHTVTFTLLAHTQVQIAWVALPSACRSWQVVKGSARGCKTLVPSGLGNRAVSVQRQEHKLIAGVGDEHFVWLGSSPGPCGCGSHGLWSLWGSAGPKAPRPHL